MMQRAVVVLGGNAFAGRGGQLTMAGQMRFAYDAVSKFEPLLADYTELLISHGNGPQVGHILTRVEEALGKAYSIPLEVCVAESEGELGYVLAQSLHNVLSAAGRPRPIATLLTQVVVDEHDEAFENPTKPIGPFYNDLQAAQLRDKGFAVMDDAGRGFRRVVPSPRPREIIEIDVMRKLLAMGVIAIAAGGGGISVVRRNAQLYGVEAVIDKDLTAALIADQLDASLLIILTGVRCAYRNYRTPRQEAVGRVDYKQAQQLIAEGHFAPGSMRPKIEAAAQFASQPGRRAIICDPSSLAEALLGRAGTTVEFD